MTAEEMAEVASRHGHAFEDALQKIQAYPGRWIATVTRWLESEDQARKTEAKLARNDAWRPNEAQQRILASLMAVPRRTSSADPATDPRLGASVRALIRRGWLSRVESDGAVEYAVLKDANDQRRCGGERAA